MSIVTEKEFMERKDYLLRLLDSIEKDAEILLPRIKIWRNNMNSCIPSVRN